MSADDIGGRAYGTVKWYNLEKGFGFITADGGDNDGQDFFVQDRGIEMRDLRMLQPGEKVTFYIEQGPKGPQAVGVRQGASAIRNDSEEEE